MYNHTILNKFTLFQYMETDDFLSQPFWYRLFYMMPVFTIFRTRLYLAFLFSESACITAAMGAYPTVAKPKCGEGPSALKELEQM